MPASSPHWPRRVTGSSTRSTSTPRGDLMERWIDTAAVLLFAGATAFVATHSRGLFGRDTAEAPTVVADEPYAARVAAALPRLERHVAAGSMRARGLACDASEELADIAE